MSADSVVAEVREGDYGTKVGASAKAGGFLPVGGKREVTLLALRHLHEVAPAPVDILPLGAGSPFGALAALPRPSSSSTTARAVCSISRFVIAHARSIVRCLT